MAVVERITEHAAEFMNRIPCAFGIYVNKGIDGVERVEKEMRIELRLEAFQLILLLDALCLVTHALMFAPFCRQLYGHGECHSQHHNKSVAKQHHPVNHSVGTGVRMNATGRGRRTGRPRIVVEHRIMPPMPQKRDNGHRYDAENQVVA